MPKQSFLERANAETRSSEAIRQAELDKIPPLDGRFHGYIPKADRCDCCNIARPWGAPYQLRIPSGKGHVFYWLCPYDWTVCSFLLTLCRVMGGKE